MGNLPASPVPLDLISLAQAEPLVGVSYWTLRRWIADGRLTGFRLGPRLLRVSRSDVLALARPVVGR